MKKNPRLKNVVYRGYELHFYEYYPQGNRIVYGYAYKNGKAINKDDYEFQTNSKNKTYCLNSLRQQIDHKLHSSVTNDDIKDSLINNYSNILYTKDNEIYIIHIDEFNWLRKKVKMKYGVNLSLEENKIKW